MTQNGPMPTRNCPIRFMIHACLVRTNIGVARTNHEVNRTVPSGHRCPSDAPRSHSFYMVWIFRGVQVLYLILFLVFYYCFVQNFTRQNDKTKPMLSAYAGIRMRYYNLIL